MQAVDLLGKMGERILWVLHICLLIYPDEKILIRRTHLHK